MIDIQKELPNVFHEFKESRQNSFLEVKKLKDKNVPVIGVFCTFFPQEFALAVGATPVSLCSMTDETIGDAEKDLPSNLCPLIKASYGYAITDKCPFFYFSDLIVGETTCDGKKKMYEYLGEFKNVYVMELPNKRTAESFELWEKELYKMKVEFEKQFGIKITEEALRRATEIKNAERAAVKDFYEIMKQDELPIMGLDLWHVLNGIQFQFDKEKIPEMLAELKKKVLSEHKHIKNKKRILITGCPIGTATEKVIKAIENAGGVVVCYENCAGAKAIDENVDLSNADIINAIAEKYLRIGCACITPNDNRVRLLDRLIDEYHVDGVVDMHLQTCTPYQVEARRIKLFTTGEKNVPYIAIDTDYSQSDVGQLGTRLEAFLEML